jgi:hypothetical protein
MQKILRSYLKRLSNLTHRNKSLLLLSLPSRQFLDLQALDFLNDQPAFSIVEQLMARKSHISLFPLHDPRFERLNQLSRQLRTIERSSRFIIEESGAEDLYVGYPFVRGKCSDGSLVRAPLLFFPVSLSVQHQGWQLDLREDAVVLNKSFLLAYSYFNQLPIAQEWMEADLSGLSKESLVFRTELYQWLKDSPIDLNFNQDLLTSPQLIPFDQFNRARFEEKHKTGELKLYPEAVLGIFPQAGSYLLLIISNCFPKTDTLTWKASLPTSSCKPLLPPFEKKIPIPPLPWMPHRKKPSEKSNKANPLWYKVRLAPESRSLSAT